MKQSVSLAGVGKALSQFFNKHHIVIYAILTFGGMAIATFLLYLQVSQIMPEATDPPASTFDQRTIKQIEELRSSDDSGKPLELPSGRVNPFE